jgi:hypothetical protein
MIAGSLQRFRAQFLLAVLVGLAIIVTAAALRFEGKSIPVDLPQANPARINIARSDYEKALAKWRAQKIVEYEIAAEIIAPIGGTFTLRVSDYGNKVEQLAPVARPASDLTAEEMEYVKRDTVEGLFAQIEAGLAEVDASKTGAISRAGNYYTEYQVSFDPILGYPQHMSSRNPDWAHSDYDLTLTSLKIIKQGK